MFVVFVTLMMLLLFSSVQVRAPVNNNTSTLQHCTVTHNTKDIKISWVKIPRLTMFHRYICFEKINTFVFLVQCQVSVERINKFMNADELDPKAVTHKSDFQDPVSVERANFSWEADNVRKILSETT